MPYFMSYFIELNSLTNNVRSTAAALSSYQPRMLKAGVKQKVYIYIKFLRMLYNTFGNSRRSGNGKT